MTRTTLAALAAAVASLILAPAAMATAQIDITCERVKIDYQQWPTGPPDVSHTVVRVDGSGPPLFDQIVSFAGNRWDVEVPLSISDGRPHTVEASHQWVHHGNGTSKRAELTCGSTPPAPAPAAPVPAAPPAPPTVTVTAPVAPVPARPAHRRAKRRAHERRMHRRAQHRATSHRAPRNPG